MGEISLNAQRESTLGPRDVSAHLLGWPYLFQISAALFSTFLVHPQVRDVAALFHPHAQLQHAALLTTHATAATRVAPATEDAALLITARALAAQVQRIIGLWRQP